MNKGKKEVNSDEIKQILARCKNIIFSISFEEFIENLNNSICEQYPKEQCYTDIFKTSSFSFGNIVDFIKYIIESKNESDIEILINNLDLIDTDNLSNILADLNKNSTWKNNLKKYIKNGIITSYNKETRTLLLEALLSEEDGAKLVVDRLEDFFVEGYDIRIG